MAAAPLPSAKTKLCQFTGKAGAAVDLPVWFVLSCSVLPILENFGLFSLVSFVISVVKRLPDVWALLCKVFAPIGRGSLCRVVVRLSLCSAHTSVTCCWLDRRGPTAATAPSSSSPDRAERGCSEERWDRDRSAAERPSQGAGSPWEPFRWISGAN